LKEVVVQAFLWFDRAAGLPSLSNRDGKGKRKVLDLTSLSSFQVLSLV
jgi:hypothetical protein